MTFPSLKKLCADVVVSRPETYGPRLKQNPLKMEEIHALCLDLCQASLLPPSIEELKAKLLLTHATDTCPSYQALKAGCAVLSKKNNTMTFESYRKTVHFALGGLVQPHGVSFARNSWEDKKFVIIDPISLEKISHLFPSDTFGFGDYSLSESAICLTTKEEAAAAEAAGWPKEKICIVAKGHSMREGVNQVIKNQQGWLVRTKPDQGVTGMCARLDEGPYRHFDLALPYFYSSALEKGLSFGPCSNNQEGGYSGLFKHLELVLLGKAYECYHLSHANLLFETFSDAEIEFHLTFIPKILEWDSFIQFVSSRLSPEAYNDWISWVYYSLQLMQLDLMVRKSYDTQFVLESGQEYPADLLRWRESLFAQIQATPLSEKKSFLKNSQIHFDALKTILDASKCPLRKPGLSFYGQRDQIDLLRNLPYDCFNLHLFALIPEESLQHSMQLCYLIDKFFLTQEEGYLVKIQTQMDLMQQQLSLATPQAIFQLMHENYPQLNGFLLEKFQKIDKESNLRVIAEKFIKYFNICIFRWEPSEILEKMKPDPEQISLLEEGMQMACKRTKNPEIQEMSTKTFFNILFGLVSCIQIYSRLIGIEDTSEILVHLKKNYPETYDKLVKWLSQVPDHPKKQQWLSDFQEAEKKFLELIPTDQKRFFEGLREGNLLKMLK